MATPLRQTGESNSAYHKRLIYGKLVDKTLAEYDYSELAPLVYGKEFSTDVARRMMYGSQRTLELLDKENMSKSAEQDALNDIEQKMIALKKERQRFFDQRNALNKILRERSRQEELNDIITQCVTNGNLPSLNRASNSVDDTSSITPVSLDNDLLVSLNDIHYGANVDNYWNKYNSDICSDMMKRYAERIIQIGQTHQSQNCIVWQNGDSINGSIHHSISVTNKENVIEQIVGVSELIAQFLHKLSHYFQTIQFVSVSGNHSRLDTKERALKDERLDDLVDWYLQARLQNDANILIGDYNGYAKVDSTMYLLDIRGKMYCGVHGDYDGSDVKVQTLQTMAGVPIYAILSAHKHHNKIDNIQGIKTVMAGSFLGMDDFCISKRIYGEPEQIVCVCDENGIRCSYDIKLN